MTDEQQDRFEVEGLYTASYGPCGDQDLIGYTIKDNKKRCNIGLKGEDICFDDKEHADVFARSLNIDKAIGDYLRKHLRIDVDANSNGYGNVDVGVALMLEGQYLDDASDHFNTDSIT